ncbi:MAG: alpha-2-macroglobulin, partial [Bradymonadaceae bacterium]
EAASADTDVGVAPDVGQASQDTGPALSEATAGQFEPGFWSRGPTEVVPPEIVVDFPRSIRVDDRAPLGDGTEIRIEPEIEGEWRVGHTDQLIFKPAESFEPGTSYDVVIEALEIRRRHPASGETVSDVLRPKEPWAHTFEMPKFKFLEALTPVALVEKGRINVDLRFSARPKVADLSKWASWSFDGKQWSQVSYERGKRKNVIQASLKGLDLTEAMHSRVGVELSSGVPFDDQRTAPAASAEQKVSFGEEVDIKDIYLKEGHDGFYLHVVCHDNSVSNIRDYHNVYDYHDYDDISERCVPDVESARRHVNIEPEVDFNISPGQAGFQIRGNFDRGTYNVEIKPGLRTIDDGVVRELKSKSIEVGPRSPTTSLVGEGRYIPPEAWKNLAVRHRNIDAVRVSIRHVPRENLVFWLAGHDHDADRRNSNLIGKSRISLGGKPDETKTSYVDLSTVVDERKQGVYEVIVEGLKRREDVESAGGKNAYKEVETDTGRLVLTDLNLIAKRHARAPDEAWSRQVDVWAVDMHAGKPTGGVDIQAVRPSGYQLASCKTGSDGHFRLELAAKQTDPAGPFALIASNGKDTTFLEYEDLKTQVPKADVGGEPYLTDKPYRLGMYGDRDLYRPAETVHTVGVMRSSQLTRVKPGIPVELKLTNSRDDLVRKQVVKTNRAGAFSFSYELGELAPTGRWRLTATVGGTQIGTHSFFVEEFVPERMKVSVDPSTKHVVAGKPAEFSVDAKYLFGASAKGSRVKTTCTVRPTEFAPEGREEYHYGPAGFELDDEESGWTQVGTSETKIGKNGSATASCKNTSLSNRRSAKLRAKISVLEAGSGRSTDETGETMLHPESYGIGLKTDVDQVEDGKPFSVQGIVTDWTGETVDKVDEVEIELISLDRDYGRYYHSGYGYDWTYRWREVVTGKQTSSVKNGRFAFKVKPTNLQDAYAVRVRAGDASSTLQLDADRYSYRYRYYDRGNTPSPATPTEVPVSVDGPVEVGKNVDVSFTAPFAGRALVAVETHRVVDYKWKKVQAGKNQWSFKLDEFVPNAYVSAFVVKDPHLESKDAFVPERAYGVTFVEVVPSRHEGSLELSVPDKVRPSTSFDVKVDADLGNGPAWVTVAAVDQGILQLTDYQSPNPLDTILSKRALGVDTFDTVGWNVRMPSNATPSGGGAAKKRGQDRATKGRVMPVNPVAMWSGMVKLENGKATIPFQVPHYRGELRVMGVAMGPKQIAASDETMKVRDPLGLQVTSPRFLSAEDEVAFPVFVTNQTGGSQVVTIEASSQMIPMQGVRILTDRGKLIRFSGEKKRRVQLADGESKTVVFRAKAKARSGAAKLRIEARSNEHRSHTTAKIPIQPAQPSERKVEMVDLESGTTDLEPHLSGWVPTSERTTFRVTDIPYAKALDEVRYLIDYPHGCVEQTTSSTRPLLYMSDLIKSIDPDLSQQYDNIDEMVEAGIDRVLSMQRSGGGFGYWPSYYHDPDVWDTAYVTDMLIDAREEGFDVPKRRLDRALEWLRQSLRREDFSHGHAYAHYVLARADRGDKAAIRSMIERLEKKHEKADDPSGSLVEQL